MGKNLGLVLYLVGMLVTFSQFVEAADTGPQNELKSGYYLLHQLADDESGVSMLFLAKDAPEQIGSYGKQVSQTGKETVTAIDKMEDQNPSLRMGKDPLPQIELDVRAYIRDDKEHQLLFGSSGNEFVRVFLTTQIQASTYGLNLCKVLADKETNPRRAQVLREMGAKWQKLRDDAFRLLRNY